MESLAALATVLCLASTGRACDMTAFRDVGTSVAGYACAAEQPSRNEVDSAVSKAMESCAGTGDANDLALQVKAGFMDSQQCDCEAASEAVYLSSRQEIQQAFAAGTTGNFDETVSAARTFSEEHCVPGTVGGVRDQSAEECVTLSEGNTTEASVEAGRAFASAWCSQPASGGEAASMAMANVTSQAVSEAEIACSFTQSVLCALTDAQVTSIAQAQIAGFAQGTVEQIATCSCGLQTSDIVARLNTAVSQATVYLHNAACAASRAGFVDMSLPLASRMRPAMRELARSLRCGSVAGDMDTGSAPSAPKVQVTPPFGKCGGNDYARTLADRLAKMVAPAIATSCCTAGYACTVKSRWYASCRPLGETPREGWNGTVVKMEGC